MVRPPAGALSGGALMNFLSEVQRRAPSWTRALDTLGPSFLPRQGGPRPDPQHGPEGLAPNHVEPKGDKL
jgi:hypothetical protein